MNSFLFHNKGNQGFTIVETLVAIAILMIAIAGPLVVATKGLNSALYAKDQMTASYLAQESMEILKNVQDNSSQSTWPGVPDISCYNGLSPSCDIAINRVNVYKIEVLTGCTYPNGLGCPLYLDTTGTYGYTHNAGAPATIFYRYFFIDTVAPNLSRITVVVSWAEHNIPYEVRISSEIVNTK